MLFGKHLVGEARWRWLLGEVLVVIIGVLAALSIEKTWSDRIDRELEFDYLLAIRTAVQDDIDFFENFQQVGLPQKMEAIEAVGPIVRGLAPIPDDLVLFFKNIQLAAIAGLAPTYAVRRVTFDDLVSTGNLRLIRDPRIRKEITSYYSSYDTQYSRTVARVTGYPQFVHGILPSDVGFEMNLVTMKTFNVDRAIEAILSDEFESLFNREQRFGFFLGSTGTQFLSRAGAFLHELDGHIEQLERT